MFGAADFFLTVRTSRVQVKNGSFNLSLQISFRSLLMQTICSFDIVLPATISNHSSAGISVYYVEHLF